MTVRDAVLFFGDADESAFDGHQTTREVLSHLVFWHGEYVKIASAVAKGTAPKLKQGTFAMLNALACRDLQGRSMSQLAADLTDLQQDLDRSVGRLASTNAKLPFKAGGQELVLGEWILRIEAHVRGHLVRFRRAEWKG